MPSAVMVVNIHYYKKTPPWGAGGLYYDKRTFTLG